MLLFADNAVFQVRNAPAPRTSARHLTATDTFSSSHIAVGNLYNQDHGVTWMFKTIRMWWLCRKLKSPSDEVRAEAATALGELCHPWALRPLLDAFHDKDSYVRSAAA